MSDKEQCEIILKQLTPELTEKFRKAFEDLLILGESTILIDANGNVTNESNH